MLQRCKITPILKIKNTPIIFDFSVHSGQARLSALSIIQIHCDIANKLNLNKIVDVFAEEGPIEGRKVDFVH